MEALQPFFMAEFLGTAVWLWLVFISVVIALLSFDLGVLHRDHHLAPHIAFGHDPLGAVLGATGDASFTLLCAQAWHLTKQDGREALAQAIQRRCPRSLRQLQGAGGESIDGGRASMHVASLPAGRAPGPH